MKFDNFVNFGVVVKGGPVSRQIPIWNEGGADGAFRFVYEKSLPVKIFPDSGVLAPGQRTLVTV